MALFDKLKEELDRAGKAAQALGYAVFRAKQSASEVDADTYARLSATLATHDAEASRYEGELDRKRRESAADKAASGAASEAAATSSTSSTSSSTSSATGGDPTSTATSESPPLG